MALTVSLASSASSTTSASSLAVSAGVSFAVNDLLVIFYAGDNSGTGGSAVFSTITDAKGNTYSIWRTELNDPAGGSAGVDFQLYYSIISSALISTDQITVNLSANAASRACIVWKVTAGSNLLARPVDDGLARGTQGSTANPASLTRSVNSGNAFILGCGRESNSAVTGDSDTTNGNWSALTSITADTGSALTSMQISSQYKIVTATGNQDWNLTAAASDWSMGWMEVSEVSRTRYVLIT